MRGIKAEGGSAVVNTEWCSVHPSSDTTLTANVRLRTDEDGRTNALMTETVHRYFPWRHLESARVHLGCYRPGDECGGGTKDHNLPAPPRGMKSCGASDSSLKFGDLNRSPAECSG